MYINKKNKKIDILAQIMSKIFTKGNIKNTHKEEKRHVYEEQQKTFKNYR